MKRSLLLTAAFSVSLLTVNAQHPNRCSTHERYLELVTKDPSIAQRRASLEEQTARWINNNEAKYSSPQTIVTIPVVVHVLYQNTQQNISVAQINSQITVLNADYSRTNSDAGNTPSAFQSIAVDCQIQFCLATLDPNGNPTTGIERRSVTVSQIGNGSDYYQYSQGGLDIWDRDRYLNIWVCDIDGGSTLGFAYLPNSTGPADDGVVIDYRFFGTTGTVSPPYDLGRTVTHEVGHWLNLEHIWGDEPSCAADDGVSDTPQQKGENYGCPTYPQTTQSGGRCNTSDPSSMFMNYMDYSDDNCMNMFSNGQKLRMQATLNGARAGLLTSNGCGSTLGLLTVSGFLPVTLYPNPSQGQFEIRFASSQKFVDIKLMNTLGEIVFESTYMDRENIEIDVRDLTSGIYAVEIVTSTARASRTLIIN